MHLSFENLTITGAPGLHASLIDFHHNTSLRSILKDDSISSSFRAHICSCLGKGVGLWLVVKPFIRLFRITHFNVSFQHFIFILVLFKPYHLIFPHVNVDMGWMHLAHT